MAGAGGIEGLHAIDGTCDLCGENCDSETQELNALTCTFAPNCPEVNAEAVDAFQRAIRNCQCTGVHHVHPGCRDAGLTRTGKLELFVFAFVLSSSAGLYDSLTDCLSVP